MGLKLEILISGCIVLILFTVWISKSTFSNISTATLQKELEFTDTTFTEVNTKKLEGNLYAKWGILYHDVFLLKNIQYSSETVYQMRADKGTYKHNILYLYGHVTLKEKDGYSYVTQQANYNQKREILYITAPFVASFGNNNISGRSLVYDASKKKAFATTIDSVIYTTEK